jgi:hypothetical protein
MVSGIYRIGGIAALIAEANRYVLATFYQENLKYVEPGQAVEIAFDLYPGQMFPGKVDSIWRANGSGQYLPSDEIPRFQLPPPTTPQGQYAVKIILTDPDQSKFPLGASPRKSPPPPYGPNSPCRTLSANTTLGLFAAAGRTTKMAFAIRALANM